MKTCVIIPVFNHQQAIRSVIEQLKPYGLTCFLINDGSSTECSSVLKELALQENSWVTLYERENNGGKGAAVFDGFCVAINHGFSHAIQIDADGQHNLKDISLFLSESELHPERMILGKPRFNRSVPIKRLLGRYITTLWIWINTQSFSIGDGLCGFRCYPLTAVEELLKSTQLGTGMDFDIDIVVRLYWQGVKVINIPTKVNYPLDGVSHFDMWQDNWLISCKHAQLFFCMLWRVLKQLLSSR